MKRISNERLASIGSMAELKQMQYRIDKAIHRTERKFKGEFAEAREMFSWKGAITYGLSMVDNCQSVFRYAMQGFQTVKDAIGRRRHRGDYYEGDCDCGDAHRRR